MTYIPVFENKFTTDGIDAKSIANTSVFTNGGSTDFVVTGAIIRCTGASSITVGPTIGLGTSAGSNDIFAAIPILALIIPGKTFSFTLLSMSVVLAPASTVYLNLSGAATGTSQTISCDLTGYWT